MKRIESVILSVFMIVSVFSGCTNKKSAEKYTVDSIPAYSGQAYVEINNNQPYFTSDEMVTVSFETYEELDELGRCGVAYACIGKDIMPDGERGEIGSIKPSGWHTVKYDNVDGK